ncbi:conserved hypothetical protein (plasmid) [Borreliella burgdorferi JD1]|uniref:DUF693 family protein n=1 Tax=Borreliella burgdorferi TaxID=139 RepID=UPI00016B3CD6|nr:DUF693 family protein [Borreliella burgdorferi]ACL33852.1 conserved hypothetical protein [Borreliella burgdorferi 156a]ACL34199.1 conserved hypothetical protein [Borreliella burgdorferi 156a]ADQ30209.1 conserved hypothetical protein [Borreliella burgdorferi JD1]ADQ30356.1 conserved hypothetical protein [Borreliella burgdorferi JD1]ADQ31379.1 conserved hypothetical protein [Borreliella burgdorferi JD1]
MLLLQYDFKIEFYKAKQSLEKDTSSGDSLIEETPKIIINTQHGIHIDITISNEFSNYNFVKSKRTKIVLWNLPLDFTNDIEVGDIVKIYYKKFAHEKNFDFIMSGYLGTPMSTDYPGGDFSVELDVRLAVSSNFFNRKLENKNFKGKTVQEAIESVFPNRNIINMNKEDRLKIIDKDIYATTPKEFVDKIKGIYIHDVIADIGGDSFDVECNFIFTNDRTIQEDENYKALEDYGLEFIPQQEIAIEGEYKIRRVYWNTQTFYTHKLKIGDKVSFIDGLGKMIKTTIKETSARLSNAGECSLILKLKDDSDDSD